MACVASMQHSEIKHTWLQFGETAIKHTHQCCNQVLPNSIRISPCHKPIQSHRGNHNAETKTGVGDLPHGSRKFLISPIWRERGMEGDGEGDGEGDLYKHLKRNASGDSSVFLTPNTKRR